MKQDELRPKLDWGGGYILIPHEILHVLGYYLVGQTCAYQWGQPYVTPKRPMPLWRDLVGMLFPAGVFLGAMTVFGILAGFGLEEFIVTGQIAALLLWLSLTFIAGFYFCTTLGDLRNAYLRCLGKPWYNWTPFDIFFAPFVDWDKVRAEAKKKEVEHAQ